MKRPKTHPREMLYEEVIKANNLSVKEFADKMLVSEEELQEFLEGQQDLSIDWMIRISIITGVSLEFWSNLQIRHLLQKNADLYGKLENLLEKNIPPTEE